MHNRQRAALLLSAALLLLCRVLPVTSLPYSARHVSSSSSWTSATAPVSLSQREREFDLLANADGIPELEPGERPANDPQIVMDKPVPPSVPHNLPNSNAPPTPANPSAEPANDPLVGDGPETSVETVMDGEELQHTPLLPPPTSDAQPSVAPELPGSDGMLGPDAAVTVQPPLPEGQGSVQPNSNELLGEQEDLIESPEAQYGTPSAPKHSVSPPAPTTNASPTPSTSVSQPSSSGSAAPSPSPPTVGVDVPAPVAPSSSSVVSFSPKPPTAAVVSSSNAPEVTVMPDPEAQSSAPSNAPSQSNSSSPAPSVSSSTSAPTPLGSPSPSTIPEILEEEVQEEELASPEASLEPAMVGNATPSVSPWDITSGNVAVTAIPPPGTAVSPAVSATLDAAVTAVVPQPPASGTSPSPVTPEVTVVVVPPPPAATLPPSDSSVTSASPVQQPASITAVPPGPPSEPEVTAVVPVAPGSPASDPTTLPSTPAIVEPAPSPALPSPSITATATTVPTPPSPAPQSPGTAVVPGGPSSADGAGFTCRYFGAGSLPGFLPPEPSLLSGVTDQFSVGQSQFPDLAPQYLSHTHGKSWTYAVPVETGSAYDFVLGFAETFDEACASGPDAGYRKFEVAIGNESAVIDVMAEAGCGNALKKTFNGIIAESNFLTAVFQGFSQQAILNTMCYRKAGSNVETTVPISTSLPTASPIPGAATGAPEDTVTPDESYQCVNFGPKMVGGYSPYDQDAITGSTFLYRGSGVTQNPELPVPYRYHLYGKDWSYSLDVSSNTAQKIVLGFAEVYPKACASGSDGAFRVFTVSIAGGVEIVDAMKSAGCGVVEQISFESVSPQNGIIDVSFTSISGSAMSMLSVLCFKDVGPPSPIESGEPIPTAAPAIDSSSDPSPNPPKESSSPVAPGSPAQESCFKFGDEVVDGFANPDLGSGVEIYTNPLATIQGTKYNSVYSSHVFGSEFTFSIQTSNTVTKSVVLGFAEVFQPACKEGHRVFDVKAGSTTQTIDVFKEVGCNTAFDLRIDGLVPSSSGVIEISFSSVADNAMLSAVCIMDEDSSTVTKVLPSEIASGSGGTTGNSADTGYVLSAQVGTKGPTSTTAPTPSPSEATTQSLGASPSPTPEKSALPKENGVIISLPEPSEESVLVGIGITSEDNGFVPTPTPSDVLLEFNFSVPTMGEVGESQSPDASPLVTVTPSQLSVVAAPTDDETSTSGSPQISPSSTAVGPTKTPSVSFSASVTPPIVLIEVESDSSLEPEVTEAAITDTEESENTDSAVMPTVTPSVSAEGQTNITVSVTAIPPNTGAFAEGSPSVAAIPPPVGTSVMPSQEPIASVSVPPTSDGSSGSDVEVALSISPSTFSIGGTPEPVAVTTPGAEDSETSLEPLITAVPPAGQAIGLEPESPVAIVPSGDPSNEPEWGGSTQSNQGVIIVTETVSPGASPSVVTLVPSPVGNPAVEILPPVDDTPLPSVIPAPSSQDTPVPFPTVSPGPISSGVASVSPISSGNDQQGDSSVGPTPSGPDDSPVGVVPGTSAVPTESPVASAGTTPGAADPDSSPSPTPSQIVSTSGTDEVITVSSVAPSPDPKESVAVVAPPKPVSSVPEDGTGIIEVTDGSSITDDTVNPDASESIVAGEFKELIGTRSEGNGFTIGMGVLGALLVLLLLICLFFAIFRSKGGAYSYSSQYSAHKPTDYDPSQGGYTEELAPGTGEFGNTYSYGQGAQDGYSGGPGTLDSHPQTQTGSFTYEGADDDLGGGSGYGNDAAAEGIGGAGGSTYANTEPDTFAEYSSLNMQQRSGYGESQGAHTGDYTFTDTFTMPNAGDYPSGARDMEFNEYRDPGPATTDTAERTALRASDSFNVFHSIARPITQESESSGKQERSTAGLHANERQGPTHAERSPVREASAGASEDTQRSDARSSSQRILSISSNPMAAQSPYESNIEMPVREDNSGNVYRNNPTNLRPQTMMRSQTTVSKRVLLHERNVIFPEGTDTETGDDFLCNDYSATQTGTVETSDERWGTLLTQEAGAVRSQVSAEGPWPSWWSDRKKLAVAPRADDLREQLFDAPRTEEDDYGDITKENETLSSTGVTRSLFQPYAQPYSPGASDRFENLGSAKPTTPLATSSKPNVIPAPSSHIAPDSGWRRMSIGTKTAALYEDNMDVHPDLEELRRRREPYVKSVANRLSTGLQSISTSMSGESALEMGRKEYEEELNEIKSSAAGRTSSSWITHGLGAIET